LRGTRKAQRRTVRRSRLLGASALVAAAMILSSVDSVFAQDIDLGARAASSDAEMLLEADTLVYDNDRNTISAVGGVRIDYDGNRLVAQRVTYDQSTSRLIASGGVELIEPSGNRIQAQEVDVTDDFRDGFVRALRIQTPDRTYFAAESAERRDGAVTTFNYGVYTACEPCEENPDKAPVWRIRAQKIIWNGETKTVRFERSRLEFLGFPLAFLPVFEIADPTVRQKSGFLTPTYRGSTELGQGVEVPYYFAISPTMDLTVAGTYLSQQGFLGEAEWRQRFNSGEYSIRIAGISQRNPDRFGANTVDARETTRGMIGSKGSFQINPRWAFGWDVMAQTDKNFANTYSIGGYSELIRRNEVYLTGINDRNYFDLRAMQFRVQEAGLDTTAAGLPNQNSRDRIQPWVLPSFDYSYTPDDPVAGGELNLDVNLTSIHRSGLDRPGFNFANPNAAPRARVRGIDGSSTRLSTEIEWKRTHIAPGGLAITPILHGRADAFGVSYSGDSVAAIEQFAAANSVAADVRSAYFRTMATAGMEARWPVLFSTTSSTHVLEPIGQIFARPDAPYGGSVGIPNEDAQSLVFDATNLFERDKFSGYDRMEGGVRANLGFRYSGSFANGWSTNAIAGQSFHLAGANPYAQPDLVYAGAFSGLQTSRSDYVGQIGVTSPNGISLSAGARLDQDDYTLARTDVTAGYSSRPFSVVGSYTYIAAQPDYGFAEDRQEARLSGSARVAEFWSVFGSATYDFERSFVTRRQIGFRYDDECFDFRFFVSENETRNIRNEATVDRTFGFTVSLRTIGEFGTDTGTSGLGGFAR
jgi:LPS-assembly protein